MMDWTTEGVWLRMRKIVLCLWPEPRGDPLWIKTLLCL